MTKKNIPQFSSCEEIIQYAMNEEKNAQNFYLKTSEQMSDPDLKRCLLKLAEMEEEHYETLKNELELYKAIHFCTRGIMSSFGQVET